MIEMGDLAAFFPQVTMQVKAQDAPALALLSFQSSQLPLVFFFGDGFSRGKPFVSEVVCIVLESFV